MSGIIEIFFSSKIFSASTSIGPFAASIIKSQSMVDTLSDVICNSRALGINILHFNLKKSSFDIFSPYS